VAQGLDLEIRTKAAQQSIDRLGKKVDKLGTRILKLVATEEKLFKQLKRTSRAAGTMGRKMQTASAQMSATNKLTNSLANGMRRLAQLVGLAAGAFTVLAAKLATEFEAEMVKIETLVGINRGQVRAWQDEVLQMSIATGESAKDISRALFAITSGGERGAEAITELGYVMQATAAGLGDARAAARLTAAALQAYGANITDAGKRTEFAKKKMDEMLVAVRLGNLEAEELSTTLGRAIGPAQALGISFGELASFVSTFSRLGVPAAEAVTSVNSTFTTLIRTSEQAQESLAQYGLSIEGVRKRIEEDGFANTLVFLVNTYKDNVSGLQDVISNIRALRGVLGTAGAQQENFLEISKMIEEQTGVTATAFERYSETSQFAFKQMLRSFQLVAIQLGDAVLPVVRDFVKQMAASLASPEIQERIRKLGKSIAEALGAFMRFSESGALTTIIKGLQLIADNFLEIKAVVTAIIGFGLSALFLKIGSALLAAATGAFRFSTALGTVSGAFGPITLAIAGAASAIQWYIDKLNAAHAATVRVAAQSGRVGGLLAEMGSKLNEAIGVTGLINFKKLEEAVPKTREQFVQFEHDITVVGTALDAAKGRAADLTEELKKLEKEEAELSEKKFFLGGIVRLEKIRDKIKELGTAVPEANQQVKLLQATFNAFTYALARADDSIKELNIEVPKGAELITDLSDAAKEAAENFESYRIGIEQSNKELEYQLAITNAQIDNFDKYSKTVRKIITDRALWRAELKKGAPLTEAETVQIILLTQAMIDLQQATEQAKNTLDAWNELMEELAEGTATVIATRFGPAIVRGLKKAEPKMRMTWREIWKQLSADLAHIVGQSLQMVFQNLIDNRQTWAEVGQAVGTAVGTAIGAAAGAYFGGGNPWAIAIGGAIGGGIGGAIGDFIGGLFDSEDLRSAAEVIADINREISATFGGPALDPKIQALAELETELRKIGIGTAEAVQALADLRAAMELRHVEVQRSLLDNLIKMMDQAGIKSLEINQKRAAIEQRIFQLTLKKLEAELTAWGLMDATTQQIIDELSAWGMDPSNFVNVRGTVELGDKTIDSLAGMTADEWRKARAARIRELARELGIMTAGPTPGPGRINAALFEDHRWEEEVDAINNLLKTGTTDFIIQLAEIYEEFRAYNSNQKALVEAYIEALKEQRTQEIAGRMLDAVKDQEQYQEQWRQHQENLIRLEYEILRLDLIATGAWAELAGLWEDALEAEIAAIDAQNNAASNLENAVEALLEYRKSLTTADIAPLSALEKFLNAQTLFYDTLSDAMAGDPEAIAALPAITDQYLALAQALYGTGADFKRIFDEVIAALDNVLISQGAYDPILDQLITMTNVVEESNLQLIDRIVETSFGVQTAVLESGETLNMSVIDLRREQEDHRIILSDIRSELRTIREDNALASAA
jgi:TP901 family phage tail tape measure protein